MNTIKISLKHILVTTLVLILTGCTKDVLFLGTGGDDYRVEIILTGDVENFNQTLAAYGDELDSDFDGRDVISSGDIFEIIPSGDSIICFCNFFGNDFEGEKTILLEGNDLLTFYFFYTNSPKEEVGGPYKMEVTITIHKNGDQIDTISRTFNSSNNEKTELKWFYAY